MTIPHPCDLSDAEIVRWRAALTAQGLTQPFEQLEREFSRDLDTAMAALRDQTLPTRRMIAQLEKHGYRRGVREDAVQWASHHDT